MGERTRADAAQSSRSGLTPAMRWALAVVAVVVAAGLAWTVWLSVAGSPQSAGPGPVTSSSPAQAAEDAGPSPGATPVDGSEVLPPASPAPVDRLPARVQATPRVSPPLPANASSRGTLVTGFPSEIAGPAPESDLLDSSVSSDGTTMQAALTARTDRAAEEITEEYRTRWAGLGLAPLPAAGAGAVSYTDAFASVTVACRASGTGTIYTVYATLRTE